MAKPQFFFSVVIPTYQSVLFIEQTLNSVLTQAEKDFELIVSDDGSTDGTVQIVQNRLDRHPAIHSSLIRNQHMGPGAARNSGIRKAAGEWIAFLDSDDEWTPNKLSVTRSHIEKQPEVDVWCHHEVTVKKTKEIVSEYNKSFDTDVHPFLSLYRQNALSTSAVLVRRSFLMKSDLFDEALLSAQDYDLWLRLSQQGKIRFIPEVLGRYLVRENNVSSQVSLRLECLLRIGKKYRPYLKQVSKSPTKEYFSFCSRAYLSSGLDLISSKKMSQKILGLIYLLFSFAYSPFQNKLLKLTLNKLSKNEISQPA